MSVDEEVTNALTSKKRRKDTPLKNSRLLSTGSTLLNCACTGRPFGGFVKGTVVLIVGDSDSGKTFLANTCLAEAAGSKHFDDYRFIYDNAEDGALMDIASFFGKAVEERLEPPKRDKEGDPVMSRTVEEFYFNVEKALEDDKPFIYVQDSENVLGSDQEDEKFEEWRDALENDKDAAGSMTDGKAKIHSQFLRRVKARLRKKGSILIILSQTRDNLGKRGPGPEKTRSGGRALKFYATIEMWSSVVQTFYKRVKGKDREIGIMSKIQIKKNHVVGRKRTVEIPIYHSYGFDDVGSCIDYLLEEKHWKKVKGTAPKKKKADLGADEEKGGSSFKAPEFEFEGKRDALIKKIEEEDLERELAVLVGEVWNEIEEACALDRKPRY